MNILILLISIALIVITLLYLYWETIKLNFMMLLITSRGIIAPNKFWWSVSDLLLKDSNGVLFFEDLKKYNKPIIQRNMAGLNMNIVMNIKYVKQILDNSPYPFGVGQLKANFFSSFMSKNLGVSEGLCWYQRRKLNEFVLHANSYPHQYMNKWDLTFNKHLTSFEEFNKYGQLKTMQIVFGDDKIVPAIFDIFQEANSVTAIFGLQEVSKKDYDEYVYKQIDNPKKYSLLSLATGSKLEIYHQIPHWIFPIVSLFNTHFPKLLLFLHYHPDVKEKLDNNLNSYYLRACILEMFRLNNPVITTFRETDSKVILDKEYEKGSHFVIFNNPILRTGFKDPNKFIPERWTPELEESYYAIMFNQGPQKCPGKNLTIAILSNLYINYDAKISDALPHVNINNVQQMVNPFSISFSYSY